MFFIRIYNNYVKYMENIVKNGKSVLLYLRLKVIAIVKMNYSRFILQTIITDGSG